MGGKAKTADEAMTLLDRAIQDGSAVRTMERMVAAQGGDARVVADPSLLEVAAVTVPIAAAAAGTVTAVDALAIGLASVAMGAGRARADAKVDPAVGISVDAKPGTKVHAGDVLARVHVRDASAASAVTERIRAAFTIDAGDAAAAARTRPAPLVRGRVEA
jgi:pyrimidine-nucleoside phosphorylase